MVWREHNGELLGSYDGHSGVIWSIDCSPDSRHFLSGSGDNSAKLWDTEHGKVILDMPTASPVRFVDFALGGAQCLLLTDNTMGESSTVQIFDLRSSVGAGAAGSKATPVKTIKIAAAGAEKSTIARWSDCNRYVLVGQENGTLAVYDANTGNCLQNTKLFGAAITDMQWSVDRTYFIASSKDHTAKIYDASDYSCKKVFRTERPVNSAAISPIRNEVILGGGQEAMSVTTTAQNKGKFEVRFFDAVLEEEVGQVRGHFGPINTVAYHPGGLGFASGAEDGYVRLHRFDPDYYNFDISK